MTSPKGRQLQVVFGAMDDVGSIAIQFYRGDDNTGALLTERILTPDERIIQFRNLEAETYWVEAQATNGDGSRFFSGRGAVKTPRDIPYLLHVLMNEDCEGGLDGGVGLEGCMEVPRIEAVVVDGRMAYTSDTDACEDPCQFVPAALENEPLRFIAIASHPQSKPLNYIWEVKDGVGLGAEDAGDLPSYSSDGTTVIWVHDTVGAFYVLVHVGDQDGGATAFAFPVYVWNEQDHTLL